MNEKKKLLEQRSQQNEEEKEINIKSDENIV